MWTWCDLSWELGSKSEVLNIDCPDLDKYPLFPKARRYECSLDAGDVLFIPGKALDHTSAFPVFVCLDVQVFIIVSQLPPVFRTVSCCTGCSLLAIGCTILSRDVVGRSVCVSHTMHCQCTSVIKQFKTC